MMHQKHELGWDRWATRAGHLFSRRAFLLSGTATAAALLPSPLVRSAQAAAGSTRFKRVPVQYIAALGDPHAMSGNNARSWGIWRQDPGPRGVALDDYERLKAAGGVAPAQWKFDSKDWWLEENGLIMESPDFPVPPGQYMVTGGREVQAVLSVHPAERDGTQRWDLSDGATIYDVTHLRCRSARYTPAAAASACSPAHAQLTSFPVPPGAAMPPVENCHKQDYAVLIVIGVGVDS
jgi:hypothetical protein